MLGRPRAARPTAGFVRLVLAAQHRLRRLGKLESLKNRLPVRRISTWKICKLEHEESLIRVNQSDELFELSDDQFDFVAGYAPKASGR